VGLVLDVLGLAMGEDLIGAMATGRTSLVSPLYSPMASSTSEVFARETEFDECLLEPAALGWGDREGQGRTPRVQKWRERLLLRQFLRQPQIAGREQQQARFCPGELQATVAGGKVAHACCNVSGQRELREPTQFFNNALGGVAHRAGIPNRQGVMR
jgi:hypothetical protein